jgi:hypothetical protein
MRMDMSWSMKQPIKWKAHDIYFIAIRCFGVLAFLIEFTFLDR